MDANHIASVSPSESPENLLIRPLNCSILAQIVRLVRR